MKYFSIGEVSEILKIKTHILRYWEKEVPSLIPKKSISGRRLYTNRDIQMLSRFKYLVQEKKYTVQGAREKMWDDLNKKGNTASASIAELRKELFEILTKLRRRRDRDMESELIAKLKAAEQGHLFDFWEARTELQREKLTEDLKKLDLSVVNTLKAKLDSKEKTNTVFEPASYIPLSKSMEDRDTLKLGEDFITSGKTAFLTVAGGQGSRLGYEGPKGIFGISPVRKASLFQIFAEKLLAANRLYSVEIPWLIMTSLANYYETVDYFKKMNFFGLKAKDVIFFRQGMLPSLYPEGKLVLSADGGLFKNPNGHGGVVKALHDSGTIDFLTERGIDEIFYFQVDNPLVYVPDPLFLGFHLKNNSEMSSKVVKKAYPEEKIGSIGLINGKPGVIEYSDLDRDTMYSRRKDGTLYFAQGSIAVHILNVNFLKRIKTELPYHIARKKVKTLKPAATGADLVEEEVVKFEMFIFDAIPIARNPIFFETDRKEEFSPLKNRTGVDSIETCIEGQVKKYSNWLEAAGVIVPSNKDGKPEYPVEISPLFALNREILKKRKEELPERIEKETLFL
ncbi:MAG: UTP--glucose-1-phosphate uridylyltransferase [Spirochaetales bacterium]|nr:UTP--glucose-1-phosphate uridylyltransferase [Spirochaetales bacterium]